MEIKDDFPEVEKGKKLHYYFVGQGQPLIILHGAASSPKTFWPQLPELSQNFRCLLPALPGHEKSYALEEGATLKDFTRSLHFLTKSLSLPKVSLLGFSFGAGVAVDFVLTYPALVGKLVILDGLVIKHPLPYQQVIPAIVEDYLADTAEALRRSVSVKTLTAERLAGHLAEYEIIHQIAQEVDFEKRLGEIKIPTLILWGKGDRVISPADGYRVHAGIKGSKLKIFPGGHTWKRSQPEVLAQVVRDFLLAPPAFAAR